MMKRLIIPFYVNHSGCPEVCVFCNQRSIAGERQGIPQDEEIRKTINEYIKSWKGEGKKEAAFYGGTFTAIDHDIQARLLKSVYPFIEKKLIDAIRVSTRPDCIDNSILAFLKDHGVRTIELGIQSMDDKVLLESGRGHSSMESVKAAALIKENGFELGCQIMPGLPGDSYEKSLQTAMKTAELNPEFVRIYPALVIRGTKMEELYHKKRFKPLTLEKAVELCAEIVGIFRLRNIRVIRVGLQPTVELEKSVVAGPYHPSFGEMVVSHIFLKRIMDFLPGHVTGEETVSITVSPKDESALRGRRNENIMELKKSFPMYKFNIVKREGLSRGSLLVN